ncbi:MAG: protein-disulfide reductase DsbD N-terminal domain-containing protein [Gemmatimonadota bacterium]|nr:protein-disulfide reductase DsbD N-terminal domain-containing protein [Gemmatimonadota bacterium]
MRQSALALGALVAGVGIGCGRDKPAAAENPVKWSLAESTTQLQAGAATTVRLTAAIDSGWYIYSMTQESGGPTRMTISVAPTPPFSLEGIPTGPQPVVIFDKEFGIETERYEGKPSFAIPVSLPTTPVPQAQNLEIKVRYQACNESFCLPARTTVVTTPVSVVGGS